MAERRRRIHELVLALIAQQHDLELLDGDADVTGAPGSAAARDPASWLQRNQRLLQRYQALVRTAVTLDTMIGQETGEVEGHEQR